VDTVRLVLQDLAIAWMVTALAAAFVGATVFGFLAWCLG
jgi:hypothetical protein